MSDQPSFAKAVSSLEAAMQALKYAEATGMGLIVRSAEGFYTAPDPSEYTFTKIERPNVFDINDLDYYVVEEHSTAAVKGSTAHNVPRGEMTQAKLADADVVWAVLTDGTRKMVKNRFGPLE